MRHIVLMIWVMVLVGVLPPAIAQPGSDAPTLGFEMGFAVPHRCGILSPDGGYMLSDDRVVYDMSNGEVVLEADFFDLPFDPHGYFSPRGRFIRTPDGVYDLAQGVTVFDPGGVRRFIFSLDDSLLYIENEAFESTVYDTQTWEPLAEVAPNKLFVSDFGPRGIMPWVAFDVPPGLEHYTSPDLRWTAIATRGIYDLENAEFATLPETMVEDEFVDLGMVGSVSAFSPDGSIFMVMGRGAFETGTWEFLYELPPGVYLESGESNLAFSSDGRVFSVQRTPVVPQQTFGIYDAQTGEALRTASAPLTFSPDLAYFAVEGERIYDFATGQVLFDIAGAAAFSPDGESVLVWGDGVYDLSSGERRFELDAAPVWFAFSPDGRFLLEPAGVRSLATGAYFEGIRYPTDDSRVLLQTVDYGGAGACLLYGQGRDWLRQSGLVQVSVGARVYDAPNGEVIGEISLGSHLRVVFAQSETGNWYRIFPGQWVAAADVTTLEMPEGVPITQ